MVSLNVKTSFFLLVFFFLGIMGCSKEDLPWRLDAEYSENLTIRTRDYQAINNQFISDTVDAIRIYKTHEKRFAMYGLSKLVAKKPVFETKDKYIIKKIIEASQETIINVDRCYENRSKNTFHFVAFDNNLMRAGYFVVKTCSVNNEEYIIIQPLLTGGGSNIYYNKALLSLLRDKLV